MPPPHIATDPRRPLVAGCTPGAGGLDPAFADRVALELVLRELRDLLPVAPSREVFVREHRETVERAGRPRPYRATLERLARAPGPTGSTANPS